MKATGKTKTAGWQAGARRTFAVSRADLWKLLLSAQGQRLLGSRSARALNARTPGVSTFVDGSHYRQKGRNGLLQVRVLAAARGRATLALHREQLPDADARASALRRMKRTLDGFEKALAEP